MSEARRLNLVLESPNTRLDRALATSLPEFSRTALARLISEGRVLVDGVVIERSAHPVRAGQTITVSLPEPRDSSVQPEAIPLRILYEDEDLAVIDKPPSIVVHPSAGHTGGTLVNALLWHLDGLSGVGGEIRPGIVHRLDKDTSGVMVIAKNDRAHRGLTAIWGSGRVIKEYLAVVYGTPSSEHATIDAPIGRNPRNRKKMAVIPGGRAARTEFRLEERFRYISMLRCTLHSGRTHQIRVHLASIGHPVVGDPAYSGPQWRGIPEKRLQKILSEFPRQALHAARLSFPHPATGSSIDVASPLPEDMESLVASMRG